MIYAGWLDEQEKRYEQAKGMIMDDPKESVRVVKEISDQLKKEIMGVLTTYCKRPGHWKRTLENASIYVLLDIARLLSE